MVTREYAKELFDYDPLTGSLAWRVARLGILVGDIAGCINSNGGRLIMVDGRRYPASKIIWVCMTGDWPEKTPKHKNRRNADDRWSNLTDLIAPGTRPRKKHADNTSGVTGVYWHKRRGKWSAMITANRQRIHLGYHDRFEDAVAARRAGERLYPRKICEPRLSMLLIRP